MAFDDFDVSFGDEEEEEGEETLVEERGPNRAFLIGAIALAAVFLLGLCAVVVLVFLPQLTGRGAAEVSPIEQTNNYNMTMAAGTETAALLTQQAPPAVETTAPPVEVVTEEATLTPTSGIITTPIVEGGTEEVGATPGEGEETPTPMLAGGTATSFIEGGEATPTRVQIVIGEGTEEGLGLGGPEGVETALPTTGFSAEAGLVGAGVLALALVVVVVVARRLRLP
jgi:hypothetical protein